MPHEPSHDRARATLRPPPRGARVRTPAGLLAAGERDLAESIASTLGDALWRHDLTGSAARPVPEAAAFAAKLRGELAALGINGPDDLATWVASLPPGKCH